MTLVKAFFISLFLMTSSWASASVLVVSDIDDTIKVSHVLSKAGAASSAVDDDSFFVGMPELYQALQEQLPETEFHYVSLAPKWLMHSKHLEFIEENDFPLTGLHTNPGLTQDPTLKEVVIRRLIQESNPQLVIYFGDNGQFDPAVYETMQRQFPRTQHLVFIREAYSSKGRAQTPTRPGQISFATSVDLGLELYQRGLISADRFRQVEALVYRHLKTSGVGGRFGQNVFPWWMDCRDFNWRWKLPASEIRLLEIAKITIQRCAEGK